LHGKQEYFPQEKGFTLEPFGSASRDLRSMLEDTDRFLTAIEIETSRGLLMAETSRKTAELAKALSDFDSVDFVALTDNPGGNPHIRPEVLGQDLLFRGRDVVINMSCKDYNRNGVESRLWALGSQGFTNVLALSGDYPIGGFQGQAQPVFDIDSVGLLELMSQMNDGLPNQMWGSVGREDRLEKTNFFAGCAVSPFKKLEGELMTQYFKLALKIRTGARFAITQIGYDSRKASELYQYVQSNDMNIPLIGSVFILTAPAGRFFNNWGMPGVWVSDELRDIGNKQAKSKDRGRAFFSELAAKQIAILKGIGYRGAYISGRPQLKRLQGILEMANSFGENDWKDFAKEINFTQPDEFYYYEQGENAGLSSNEVNKTYLKSKSKSALAKSRVTVPLQFRVGKFIHDRIFTEGTLGFKAGKAIYGQVEKSKKLTGVAHVLEQASKVPIYQCQDCGDCSLPDIAYLCPESQCVKSQRNGPCGGTKAGKCEILDQECIWIRAYDRLKPFGDETKMLERPVVFRDASLRNTSAWANTFLERDHHAKKNTPDNSSGA
jgi:methylenetetrahydrofolate reductase (NADPH)